MKCIQCDIVIVGSGIAGLSFALKAAKHGSVIVITKKDRSASNTNYAQGGIAAVMAPDDTAELHIGDTLEAGAGLCDEAAVNALVREGPARVRDLIDWGVRFTQHGTGLSLGREAGHSRRRIVHAADLTGREIERALLAALEAHENVELIEDCIAIDLVRGRSQRTGALRCAGVIALDHASNELVTIHARVTMLATGGLGQAYQYTTNPEIATGDGVAMAYRLGAKIANMEFVQFHPTALYPAHDRAFLISEAVRGEGAVLRRMDGEPLMAGHEHGSLAPRDVVARAIHHALSSRGDLHVWLDLSPIPKRQMRERFPNIVAECEARGLDIGRDPLPVVPAAHYCCGGVWTDAHARTSVPGLLAVGEVACTGVHGANRLASNSLLEAVVYSHRAAQLLEAELRESAACVEDVDLPRPIMGTDAAWSRLRAELRLLMWEHVGIIRNDAGLELAAQRLDALAAEVDACFEPGVSFEAVEIRHLVRAAWLVVESARMRKESRGLHYNADHPYSVIRTPGASPLLWHPTGASVDMCAHEP